MSASRKRPSELLDITAEDGPTEQIEASEENDEKPFKRVDIKDSIDSKDSVPPASVPFVGFSAYASINPFAAKAQSSSGGFAATAAKSTGSTGGGGWFNTNRPAALETVPSVVGTAAAGPSQLSPLLLSASPRSPKVNPFSSTSPVINPFVSVDSSTQSDALRKIFSFPPSATGVSSSGTSTTTAPPAVTSTDSTLAEPSTSTIVSTDSKGEEVESQDVSTENDKEVEDNVEAPPSSVDQSVPFVPSFVPPASFIMSTGEEEEDCIFQTRSKLFRLQPNAEAGGASSWVEVGTGPLRILQKMQTLPQRSVDEKTEDSSTSASESSNNNDNDVYSRLVMRREGQAGGTGTKLLLNVALSRSQHVSVSKPGEKAVQMTCVSGCPTEVAVKPAAEANISSDVSKPLGVDTDSHSSSAKANESVTDSFIDKIHTPSAVVVKPVSISNTYLFKLKHANEAIELFSQLEALVSTTHTPE